VIERHALVSICFHWSVSWSVVSRFLYWLTTSAASCFSYSHLDCHMQNTNKIYYFYYPDSFSAPTKHALSRQRHINNNRPVVAEVNATLLHVIR